MPRDNGNRPAKPPWFDKAITQTPPHHKHPQHHTIINNNKENKKKNNRTRHPSNSHQQHTPLGLRTGLRTHKYRSPLQEIRNAHENNNRSRRTTTNGTTKPSNLPVYQCPIERRTVVPEGTDANIYIKNHQYRPTLQELNKALRNMHMSHFRSRTPQIDPTTKAIIAKALDLTQATTKEEVDLIIHHHMITISTKVAQLPWRRSQIGTTVLWKSILTHHIDLISRGTKAKRNLTNKTIKSSTSMQEPPVATLPTRSITNITESLHPKNESPLEIILQQMINTAKKHQDPPVTNKNTSTFSFEYTLKSITIRCKHARLLHNSQIKNMHHQEQQRQQTTTTLALSQQQAITSPRLISPTEINAQLAHLFRLHERWKNDPQTSQLSPTVQNISSSPNTNPPIPYQPNPPKKIIRRQLPPRASQCRAEVQAVKRKHTRWKMALRLQPPNDQTNSMIATTMTSRPTTTTINPKDMMTITRTDSIHTRYKQHRRKPLLLRTQDLQTRFLHKQYDSKTFDQSKHKTSFPEYFYDQDRPPDLVTALI